MNKDLTHEVLSGKRHLAHENIKNITREKIQIEGDFQKQSEYNEKIGKENMKSFK